MAIGPPGGSVVLLLIVGLNLQARYRTAWPLFCVAVRCRMDRDERDVGRKQVAPRFHRCYINEGHRKGREDGARPDRPTSPAIL
jgi:hypothetical protein